METRKEAGVVVALALALAVPAWMSAAGRDGRVVRLESLELRSGEHRLRIGERIGARGIGMQVTGATGTRAEVGVHPGAPGGLMPVAYVELRSGDRGVPRYDLWPAVMEVSAPGEAASGAFALRSGGRGPFLGLFEGDPGLFLRGRKFRIGWDPWGGRLLVVRERQPLVLDWSGVTRPGPEAER